MKKKILITGPTGFVGRQVLKYLVKTDADITLIARNKTNISLLNLPIETKIITTSNIFAETTEWWANVLLGVDTVIHLAWYVEPGKYLQSSKNIDCLNGTLNLAKAASQVGIKRFIGIGTCFEYDLSYGLLSVNTPLKPLTPYAKAKVDTYLSLSAMFIKLGIEFAWCRLFYLYGDGENPKRLVPYLREKLQAGEPVELTSGKQTRDFIEVSEAGRLICETALSNFQGPINICSGIPITVMELAENIADEYGRRDLLMFGVRKDNFFDPPYVVGQK
jgi:nucleoside-diphosphate-sugar epimerase